jgi:hypothetical protein
MRFAARRMHAFARELVARCPRQPGSQLALSVAYLQFYNNASREDDRLAGLFNLGLALTSAQQAFLLDTKSDTARRAVARLEGKLNGLGSSR